MTIQQTDLIRENGYSDDEISLYDLYRVLVKRKNLIAIVFASILVICIAYLIVTPKIYQVSTLLFPPSSGDMYLTNIDLSKVADFQPEQVFKLYAQELTSNDRWYEFTKQETKLFHNLSTDDQLHNPFKLDKDKDIPNLHILLKYDTSQTENAVAIVKRYLRFAEQGLIAKFIQQISSSVSHSIKTLELAIQLARESAKQARLDQITQLESDLAIAKRLGIVDNLYFSLASKAGDKESVLNIFTNNPATATYLKGTKVITAELDSLKHRESDDPFIPSLRQKQDQLKQLKELQYSPELFHAYDQDGEVKLSTSPVKPKKILVLLLGGILGLFLGMFAAFIAEFIAKARELELAGG
jgi:chain length determinant protein (polysaccharide antigen chain regulator)